MRGLILALALGLAGCTATVAVVEERVEGAACDARVLDLNRRLCAEKAGTFFEPSTATPCGACLGFGVPLR